MPDLFFRGGCQIFHFILDLKPFLRVTSAPDFMPSLRQMQEWCVRWSKLASLKGWYPWILWHINMIYSMLKHTNLIFFVKSSDMLMFNIKLTLEDGLLRYKLILPQQRGTYVCLSQSSSCYCYPILFCWLPQSSLHLSMYLPLLLYC